MTQNSGQNVGLVAVGRSLVAVVRAEQISFLAASLAYYSFVSLLPLLLLVLAVGSALGGEALARSVVEQVQLVLTPAGQDVLLAALTNASGRASATVVGVLVLGWSGLRLFRGLDVAFSIIYGTTGQRSVLGGFFDALVALVAVGIGVGLALALNTVVGLVGLPLLDLLGGPALATALTITFLPLYVLLPGTNVGVREALPGAVFAGGGWTVLGIGFRVYTEMAGTFQLYGVIGGVLLLVTWFYFGATLLLVGGVLNAVLADRVSTSNRQLQQVSPRRVGQRASMTDELGGSTGTTSEGADDGDRADELAALRADIEAFEEEIEERTVHREEIERDLKRYVRRRVRRGHARGWGPYLVLLYGTVMTLGAFYLLDGGWAILAMLVVWLSTLGLYALMVIVGMATAALGLPGRLRTIVDDFRR